MYFSTLSVQFIVWGINDNMVKNMDLNLAIINLFYLVGPKKHEHSES